jgi:hypothetical protein
VAGVWSLTRRAYVTRRDAMREGVGVEGSQ